LRRHAGCDLGPGRLFRNEGADEQDQGPVHPIIALATTTGSMSETGCGFLRE
jgi:hypothetical protein